MARRCGPSTTAYGGGPPPHRFATGRILRPLPTPKQAPTYSLSPTSTSPCPTLTRSSKTKQLPCQRLSDSGTCSR